MTVIRAAKLSERAFVLPAVRPRRDEPVSANDTVTSDVEKWVADATTKEQIDESVYEVDQSTNVRDATEETDEPELGIYTERGTVGGQTTSVEQGAPDISYEEYKRQHQSELDVLRAQTVAEAMAEADRTARDEIDRVFRSELENLQNIVQSAQKAVEQDLDSLADTAVEIVYEALLKILGKELANAEGAAAAVREVIRHAKDRSKLVVRVSPTDFSVIRSRGVEHDIRHDPDVQIVADDRVELGGCLLETPAGNLDGRLETQLQLLRETLLQARTKWNEPEA